jgi:poly(3-hydroxybutyrate) depolymerase
VSDDRQRLGSSGIFKIIVDGARKFKRAVSEGDTELSAEAHELATTIAQAFIAGRFADVHGLGTPPFQQRHERERFAASWRNTVADRVLTGYQITDAGHIELGFIPGLEEVAQDDFVGFAQIQFSTPDDKPFTIGAVMLDHGGVVRLGALHAS